MSQKLRALCLSFLLPLTALVATQSADASEALPLIISFDVSGSMLPPHVGAGTYEELIDAVTEILFEGPLNLQAFDNVSEFPDQNFLPKDEFPLICPGTQVSVFTFDNEVDDIRPSGPITRREFEMLLPKLTTKDTDMNKATHHAVFEHFGAAKTGRALWLLISDGRHDPSNPATAQGIEEVEQRRQLTPRYPDHHLGRKQQKPYSQYSCHGGRAHCRLPCPAPRVPPAGIVAGRQL